MNALSKITDGAQIEPVRAFLVSRKRDRHLDPKVATALLATPPLPTSTRLSPGRRRTLKTESAKRNGENKEPLKRSISYILYPKSQMVASQSPFLHPPCLEAHATPRHESVDCAPCKSSSTRLHPLTPPAAPGSPAGPCSEYTHAQETKERVKEEERTQKAKNRWKGPASITRRRLGSGISERPEMYQPSTLTDLDLNI